MSKTMEDKKMPVADDDLKYVEVCLAATDGSHPGELLERRELEAQVQKCISALAEDYREVLNAEYSGILI
ncbi:MAG: hypothetical protein ABFD45_00930 [Smithella sp.]